VTTLDLSDLEAFAKKSIGAEHYPDDQHPCKVAECELCGVVPLELSIEHDEGSKPGRFKGMIWVRCSKCGARKDLLAFTAYPERGKIIQVETPTCACGSVGFYVLECERIEVWDGVPSFFDEGVVAGKCARCGALRAFVFTD
jgi:hypothetical protein